MERHPVRAENVSAIAGVYGGSGLVARAGDRRQHDDLHAGQLALPQSVAGRARVRAGRGLHGGREESIAVLEPDVDVVPQLPRLPRSQRRLQRSGRIHIPAADRHGVRRRSRTVFRRDGDGQLLRRPRHPPGHRPLLRARGRSRAWRIARRGVVLQVLAAPVRRRDGRRRPDDHVEWRALHGAGRDAGRLSRRQFDLRSRSVGADVDVRSGAPGKPAVVDDRAPGAAVQPGRTAQARPLDRPGRARISKCWRSRSRRHIRSPTTDDRRPCVP